jgi:hypothetical protein
MILPELFHPYCRYGLAVALERSELASRDIATITEMELRESLAKAIEDGLTRFRLEPRETLAKADDPKAPDRLLSFQYTAISDFQNDASLIQSAGLSNKGRYLSPNIMCSDGSARATFEQSGRVIKELRDSKALLFDKPQDLKRSFAPIAGEINNGKRNKENPKGSLFEAACSTIATVTSFKPSSTSAKTSLAIFPDLSLDDLRHFVRVFTKFQEQGTDLLTGKITSDGKPKRPKLHRGNYPYAVSGDVFGAAGLLAAIGYWATEAEYDREEARKALENLAGCPIYVLGYEECSQVRFHHHVISLAKDGRLYQIISTFLREVKLYATYEQGRIRFDDPQYKFLLRGLNHFLQFFDPASFQGFLASRAEYPIEIRSLLETYFMQTEKINPDIVRSALALGQWINQTAYFVARDEIAPKTKEDWTNLNKAKAKILVEFESAVFSAKDGADLLSRVSVRSGRLMGRDVPNEATEFYVATAIGDDLTLKQAQQLVVAFLRIAPPRKIVEEGASGLGQEARGLGQEGEAQHDENDDE